MKQPEDEDFMPVYWKVAGYYTEADIAKKYGVEKWKMLNGGMDELFSEILEKKKK